MPWPGRQYCNSASVTSPASNASRSCCCRSARTYASNTSAWPGASGVPRHGAHPNRSLTYLIGSYRVSSDLSSLNVWPRRRNSSAALARTCNDASWVLARGDPFNLFLCQRSPIDIEICNHSRIQPSAELRELCHGFERSRNRVVIPLRRIDCFLAIRIGDGDDGKLQHLLKLCLQFFEERPRRVLCYLSATFDFRSTLCYLYFSCPLFDRVEMSIISLRPRVPLIACTPSFPTTTG